MISDFRLPISDFLLSRPAGTLSATPSGGEGRGEEALRFMRAVVNSFQKGAE